MSIDFSLLNFNNLKVKFNITRNLILKHIFTFFKMYNNSIPNKIMSLMWDYSSRKMVEKK